MATRNVHRSIDTDDLERSSFAGFLDMTDAAPGSMGIAVSETREFTEAAEYEAFMNEPVGIIISKAMSPTEPREVPVGVNNNVRWLPRNTKLLVRRFHLERLVRSQVKNFATQAVNDPNADAGHTIVDETLPSFHITVLRDDNAKGAAWLARMAREGC